MSPPSAVAHNRQVSFNTLVLEALQQVLTQEQRWEMHEAASLLGEDAALGDAEFAFRAQSEVVLSDR
ncbi:MAG TPA: hypothetical protein VGN26_18615 [Armatimonadota bacterium]|jgi:hypothetical protein